MKQIFAPLAALALVVAPAVAVAEEDTDKTQTEQAAPKETGEAKDNEKDSGIVEKGVKMKAIDSVGNDGIVEKGAKAKVLTDK